jgi:isoleucyl-tRNA synthetase
LAAGVTEAMDAYELQQAVRPFVRFMEDLTNWYIRRSRRRFWKSQDDADKAHAYATLYRVLQEFSKIAAPFLPFLAEAVHRNLRTADLPESVHLCDFPAADGALRDPALEESMDRVMTCVRLGRNLRAEHDLKVRQPLPALRVVTRNAALRHELAALQDIIADELNVKAVHFGEHETELATLRAKPDFKVLGPRLGPRVKEAAKALAALPSEALAPLTEGGAVRVTVGGEAVELRAGDVVLERAPKAHLVVAAEGEIVVALETELTPELLREGLARELVNKIQNMRKDAGLEVTQRIAVTLAADDEVRAAVEAFGDYVRAETLSVSCVFGDPAGQGAEWDLNGRPCRVRIEPQRGA